MGQSFAALSEFDLPSSTSSGVLSLWNNYKSTPFLQLLQNLNIAINDPDGIYALKDASTRKRIYLTEYDKLTTDRSIICIKEGDKYTVESTIAMVTTLLSPQLKNISIDSEEENEVDVLIVLVDITTGKVNFIQGTQLNTTDGEITCYTPDLGIAFIAYRFYKPVDVFDEEKTPTYKFIETPDMNSDNFPYGYIGRDKYAEGSTEFISNSKTYYDIYFDDSIGCMYYSYLNSDGDFEQDLVYSVDSGWVDAAYRTVEMATNEQTYNYFAYKWLFTDGNWVEL